MEKPRRFKKYRVFVNGENFAIRVDGEIAKYGFYTTRYVLAKEPEHAENLVMDLIRDELKPLVLNDCSDSPMMYAEEIDELYDFDDCPFPGRGFTWYDETSDQVDNGDEDDELVDWYLWERRDDGYYRVGITGLRGVISVVEVFIGQVLFKTKKHLRQLLGKANRRNNRNGI